MTVDPLFKVEVLSRTPNPQRSIYLAMHQDYSEGFVHDEWKNQLDTDPSDPDWEGFDTKFTEPWCGKQVVDHLLKGGRGHFGPLEHPQIVFNVGYFPHSTMQQIRTHRVGVSFDVQSFRYTGQRIVEVAKGKRNVEEVFYLRPADEYYPDRNGGKYYYDIDYRYNDLQIVECCVRNYAYNISKGMPEEQARSVIPFDVRQHWVMSCNIRSLMHILDLRAKADAQLECQQLCDMLFQQFQWWCPEIANWYKENRYGKARLAP